MQRQAARIRGHLVMEQLIIDYGDDTVLMAAGAIVGAIFGVMAQHSRFCLRSATVELAEGHFGPRIAIWLIAFSAAIVGVQAAISLEWLNVSQSRQLAAAGSMSGAIIGGLVFGVGMILARGCASRLLVLSAPGNLRAIVTGLVLTLVAQMSLRGVLAPSREALATIWMIPGGAARSILEQLHIGTVVATLIALAVLIASLILARSSGVKTSHAIAAVGVGGAVALGWIATYTIASNSFEVVAISSVTFTGPSTDTLMGLVNNTQLPFSFGVGLVPGVFAGAAVMAVVSSEFKIQRFGPDNPMEQHLIGATFMGFGSMLAGGCAVGAGMSGGAIFCADRMDRGRCDVAWRDGDPHRDDQKGAAPADGTHVKFLVLYTNLLLDGLPASMSAFDNAP
jgi:uncharacterized membrane protein YedE/YeeE